MQLLLNTDFLKYQFESLYPIKQWLDFEPVLDLILQISYIEFSRDFKTRVWELLENSNSDKAPQIDQITNNDLMCAFDLNIDMFMESVQEYLLSQANICLDYCTINEVIFVGNTVAIDISVRDCLL